ncbi:MAG TPA: HDOD domain-containing protein [Opitutaceae bacterium]|nr:HDOD domain-containing protein [Opitutaceae bacterium]
MCAKPITDARLAAAAAKLSAAPRVFQQLSAAMKDPDVSVDDIVSVVRLDAVLSAKVLRVCNSAQFARGGHVSALDEAVDRIGLYEVYRLVGAAVASQLYNSDLSIYGVTAEQLWLNSVTTAVGLEAMAANVGEEGSVGYTLGLLRPVGRLLLQSVSGDQDCKPLSGRHPTAALVAAWEFDTFGTTSTEAVDRLFHMWGFGPSLTEPIRNHFAPAGDPSGQRITALLHVACWITAELGQGLSIEQHAWALSDDVLAQAGLTLKEAQDSVQRTKRIADRLAGMMKAA